MSTSRILMLIGAFLLLTVGSFVYFVATWDAEKEQPVSFLAPTFTLSGLEISPPEAQDFSQKNLHPADQGDTI